VVNTTVQEKAIASDARLSHRAIEKLVALAVKVPNLTLWSGLRDRSKLYLSAV
jgi:hypothetical protein